VKAELQQLVSLQNLDISIRRLQAEIEAIPLRRAEIEKEFDQRAFEIRALETRRDDARHERARVEKEIADQRMKAERGDRNVMSAKKPEEYAAAIREADAARKQILTFETQILEQMELSEQAEAELKERAAEVASLNSDREAALQKFDEGTSALTGQLEASRAERERVSASLPKAMSQLYNRISTRIRDGIAVAEARNSACAACFMALRPQVMAQVRRGDEIIICDNCNRILYYVTGNNKPLNPSSERSEAATT
jgi:predicted  nucleic acid-binding Zn-ribbon protein